MHVATLADDSLEGREAGSRGGRAAGAYLLQQFQQSLEAVGGQLQVQPFGAGYRNLLGQLEGSDPQRHSEYVLVRCPLRSRRLRLGPQQLGTDRLHP